MSQRERRRSWRTGRIRHITRRLREAPTRFILTKLALTLKGHAWALAYAFAAPCRNARFANRHASQACLRVPSDIWLSGPELDEIKAAIESSAPGHASDVIHRAERALVGRITCLGFGELSLGEPVDWRADTLHQVRWSKRPGFWLEPVHPKQSDVKVVWEINRLQFLVWLAQGWVLTRRPEFRTKLVSLLHAWDRENPTGIGVAWSCPMEVAIRGMNIAAALRLVGCELGDKEVGLAFRLIRSHYKFVRRHLELSDVNGNHYMADLSGLVYLGSVLYGPDNPPRKFRDDVARFRKEIEAQAHADGVHIEHATGYQRLVLELCLAAVLCARQRGHKCLDRTAHDSLTSMAGFLASVANADGHIPIFGDSDSGQVVISGTHHPNDVRPLLDRAARLLGDLSLRLEPTNAAAAMWEEGPSVLNDLTSGGLVHAYAQTTVPQLPAGKIFAGGGYVVLRAGGAKVVVRAGAPGLLGRGAHDHIDQTSFTACLDGVDVVVDSGSSTYTGNRTRRIREIAAQAHNVATVDDVPLGQIIAGSVMDVVSPTLVGRALTLSNEPIGVSVTHNGFERVSGLDFYSRRLTLEADGRTLYCADSFEGSGHHKVTLRLHVGVDWRPLDLVGTGLTLVNRDGVLARVQCSPCGEPAVQRTLISSVYGATTPAMLVTVHCEVEFPVLIETVVALVTPPSDSGE